MSRILAIDYGRKRVGLAVTDPLEIIANGLETVPTMKIWEFLKDYIPRQDVKIVVVGYPVQMNSRPSESMEYLKPFLKKFAKVFPDLRVELVDERFTSKMAMQAMIEGGMKKKQRRNKAMVDKISAVIILQTYLDMQQRFN
ncbi:MAG: Holliday junction resolvase RuvX [Bacteroidales bacterium]|nr:Holliday junction resolvase RuvX [Bacteroidales bacterium]